MRYAPQIQMKADRLRRDFSHGRFTTFNNSSAYHRNNHSNSAFSTLRSIASVVIILISLSFITVSINGNLQKRSSISNAKPPTSDLASTTTTSSSVKLADTSNVDPPPAVPDPPQHQQQQRVTAFAEAAPVVQQSSSTSTSSSSKPLGETLPAPQSPAQRQTPVRKEEPAPAVENAPAPVVKQQQAPPPQPPQQQQAPAVASGGSTSTTSSDTGILGPDVPLLSENKVTRRSRAKAFMMVFMGHSGSTALITEIRNHPDFEVEELEPVDHGEYLDNTEMALKHARELLDRGIAKGKIPGFKVRPLHIRQRPEEWAKLVKEYDVRIFWQFRVNIVKQAIGEYRHRVLNDTSVVEGLKATEKACDKSSGYNCQFRVDDLDKLHDLLNDFSLSDEVLSEAVRLLKRDDHMLAVKYEDYLYRRKETMRDTFAFLGVEHTETEASRAKASPDSLCHMVLNYQEVCRAFYACQLWRPYFDDDRNDCYCRPTNGNSFDKRYCHRLAWYQQNK